MIKKKILEDLKKAVEELGLPAGRQGYESTDIVCSIPKNSGFGDYTTNLPLQLAKQREGSGKQNPEEIAKQIIKKLWSFDSAQEFCEIKTVGGFINFFIKQDVLMESLHRVCNYSCFVNPEVELDIQKKKILVEYASFNALKPVHVGHLRNITLGESVVRLLEAQGNEIFKVTYTSDIGLPTAKVVWAINESPAEFKKYKKASLKEKANFLGRMYINGNTGFEEDEKIRDEIKEINKKLYEREPKMVKIWQEALNWTFEYFDSIYNLMGTKFDKEILESEAEDPGKKIVLDNIGKVFKKDQGAVIFPGSEHGLHNRVFISSEGNPTYEAKDMGLADLEYEAFPFDLAIHVVANDQDEYFKVIFKALEQLNPDLAKKESHLSYGYVLLPSGKMSSRNGNVETLEEVYEMVKERVKKLTTYNDKNHKNQVQKASPFEPRIIEDEKQQIIDIVSIGAIKFALLKFAPRTDIIFDLEKSVSLSGDSGPYLQYAYTRAKSVLRNGAYDYQVDLPHSESHPKSIKHDLERQERELLRKIEHFEGIVEDAAKNFAPNTLATYLLELASLFNTFYQKHQILKSEQQEFRLALTCCIAVILKQGLNLLGIDVPERM